MSGVKKGTGGDKASLGYIKFVLPHGVIGNLDFRLGGETGSRGFNPVHCKKASLTVEPGIHGRSRGRVKETEKG